MSGALGLARSLACTVVFSAILVFLIELMMRGSLEQVLTFFQSYYRPWWTTVLLFTLVLLAFDALFGRAHHALIVIAPVTLLIAWICRQKVLYLGDPLYPTDFLYSRQVIDLMPMLVRDRPFTAMAIAIALILSGVLLVSAWRFWRHSFPVLDWRHRCARLAIAIPALAAFVSVMDYATFSWARDRLQIYPMMWDQKENYAHNGLALAFALNVPMASVTMPKGYTPEAINAISAPLATTFPEEKPDIIVVMSESFWDPSRLPGVEFSTDPIPTVRASMSGHVFSPEFGGMTSNVEFEALTGFSNAFLPYGSIPYQQYIRRPLPSLAAFLKHEGYETRAFHPYREWFWNRGPVYKAFGFEQFMSEETLPVLAKRGPLVSDEALTEEIIRQADETEKPFFFFAVTLQSHGPYEPGRYPDATIDVSTAASERTRQSIITYAEGAADADRSLERLLDWAKKRERPTVIALFGDHLPPLGPVYVETGFMPASVASRTASPQDMMLQHETPLVIWSNRDGAAPDLGSISPSFLPYHVLKTAGITHPYYTGFLGNVREQFRVVDRHLLLRENGGAVENWARAPQPEPIIQDFRLLQYDMIFGKRNGTEMFFPETIPSGPGTV
ncbi:MAG: LTA synthase family protein [Phyllobacterium sp.]